jgi:hypothetical protein
MLVRKVLDSKWRVCRMRQPTFLRSGCSLTQIAAIGASFCKADGTRIRTSDGYTRRLHIFMSSRRDGVGILEPRYSSAIKPRHNFGSILSPSMGHPQAPLKMRNVRRSKVSIPNVFPDYGNGAISIELLQASELWDHTNILR